MGRNTRFTVLGRSAVKITAAEQIQRLHNNRKQDSGGANNTQSRKACDKKYKRKGDTKGQKLRYERK